MSKTGRLLGPSVKSAGGPDAPLCRLVIAALCNGPHQRTINEDESIVIAWERHREGFVFKSLGKDVTCRRGTRIVYDSDEKRTLKFAGLDLSLLMTRSQTESSSG
jgi:hypothetical protein